MVLSESENANKHVLVLEYSYIWLHMGDNLLFNVENIIITGNTWFVNRSLESII